MENKQDDIDSDPDSDSAPPVQSNKKAERLVIFLIGLTFFGFFSLLCLSSAVYLAIPRFINDSPLSTTLADKPMENQIAFVGNDHNIWLVSPDGSHLRSVTGNERESRDYLSPAWAPDGRHIAFVGQKANRHAALYIASTGGVSDLDTVYNVSDSSPFYLYWTPTSQAITFLTQEANSLSMRLVETDSPGDDRVLEKGQPFYWAWSPRGDELLMHVGGASEDPHLSFLKSQQNASRIELKIAPGNFQSPLWSADNQYVYYVAAGEDEREAIYKMDPGALEQTKLLDLAEGGTTYLTLSPDSRRIAYLKTDNTHPIPVGAASVMDVDGQNHQLLTRRSVASIYWSPDGSKLALLVISLADNTPSAKSGLLASPAAQQMQFQWWVYSLDTDRFELLFTIDPTSEFLQTVPYFDQYHLSLTFWSPDSRYFVLTTENAEKEGSVIVVDTTGQESPRPVGEGTLAVWSWQ